MKFSEGPKNNGLDLDFGGYLDHNKDPGAKLQKHLTLILVYDNSLQDFFCNQSPGII